MLKTIGLPVAWEDCMYGILSLKWLAQTNAMKKSVKITRWVVYFRCLSVFGMD
jgi:hypothetical protein